MLEIYILLTLCAVGFLLNKTNADFKKPLSNQKQLVNLNEMPSMKNIYESKHYNDTDATLWRRGEKKFNASLNPEKTNVISYNHPMIMDELKEAEEEKKILSLSGEYISKDKFTHENMTPFYGGTVKQNMDDKANRVLLENFTGVSDIQTNKCEVASFYDVSKNMGNVNGSQDAADFYKDRIVAPTLRAHEFPIPQLHVGPGLGMGYTATPTGGYQQFESQDYATSRTVDQLRTKLNPDKKALGISDIQKTTYKGRTVDGLKTSLMAGIGKVNKNRVNTDYEQTQDMWLKTTAANLKPYYDGDWDVKETNRMTTSRENVGTAYKWGQFARTGDPLVKKSTKQQLKADYYGPGALDTYGVGEKFDYGKAQILVYNNERDVTSTKVYQGNVLSLVKAIIAPIEDMIKITKKQEGVDNPRHFGNLNIQIPNKQTVYDPNDTARTTIKETTVHDAIISNLKGHEKLTVHDPNDTARTTIKETTIHDAIISNLKGYEKLTVHDPNDVARTTTKETLVHEYLLGNLKGNEKLTVHDPNDVARTTIKETTVHDYLIGNLKGNEKITVWDPNDVTRTTIKETTIHEYLLGNLKGNEKLTVHDPNDVARTTTKETMVHEFLLGNLKGNEKLTIYDPNDIARTTTKETTVHEYLLGNLKGYEKIQVHDPNDTARTTTKETTIHEYLLGNLKGYEKIQVHDPNDVARTTLKETLIHDESGTYAHNLTDAAGAKQLYVYDPEEIAKKTIRETLEREDYELNLAARVYKGTAYDPEDIARKTTKETIVGLEREYGNLDRMARGGGYETNEYDAKDTQKQFLSDYEYYGVAMRDSGEGYITNEYDAKVTQKQFLSDHEYYGGANAVDSKKEMSYDDMYNANITERQEVLLFERDPTQTSVKVFNDCINVATPRKNLCEIKTERNTMNRDHIMNNIPTLTDYTVTKMRKNTAYEVDDRLDVSLLDAFKENPYTFPLNSAPGY